MRSAIAVILTLLASSPACGHQNMKEALGAPPADPRQGGRLRREAVQFIVDSCRLKWDIDSPFALKDGPPLTALVSPNRGSRVLTRPCPSEGCDGARGAVAIGHYLDWMRTAPAHELSGGDSLAGFSVTLPEADSLYETGSWVAFMNDGVEYTGTLQRLHPGSAPSLHGATPARFPNEADWAMAEKSILRLPPTAFPQLPHGIQEWLMRRGFTIPQTFYPLHRPHNVISGAFERHGSADWACLASRGDSSAIVVFFSGSTDRPIEMEWAGDRGYLQTYTADSIGYSRLIGLADSARISDGFARDGQEPPVPVTHDGIEHAFIEKGSLILYYDNGGWRAMIGSD